MKNIGQIVFISLIIVVVSVALFISRDWNSVTALFPRSVGFPVLGLAIVSLVMDIVKFRRERSSKAIDRQSAIISAKPILAIFGWIVGFIAVTWIIGLVFAVPVFVFAFMKVQGKYSWIKSIVYAVIAGSFIYIVFVLIFKVIFPNGVLNDLIYRMTGSY